MLNKYYGDLSSRMEWPGQKADQSSPSSTNAKNVWSYTFTHPYTFLIECLIKDRATLPLQKQGDPELLADSQTVLFKRE
jgi:hypothetical protein